jgi:hypothetical protein
MWWNRAEAKVMPPPEKTPLKVVEPEEDDTGEPKPDVVLTLKEEEIIKNAVRVIDRLITEGKLPDADIYEMEMGDPETDRIIKKIQKDLDHHWGKLWVLQERVEELQKKREAEKNAPAVKLVEKVDSAGLN